MRTFFILFFFGPFLAYGQHVFLHFQDGSTHSYETLDVLSTIANGTELEITFVDGTMLSYSFVDLKRIQHGDISTTTDQEIPDVTDEFRVYPNPFSDHVHIEGPGKVSVDRISVIDQAGREVRIVKKIEGIKGDRWTWDGTDDLGNPLPDGTYTFRLSNGPITISKKVVLHR